MREFHSVANLFPLLEGDEFAELVKDIGENGLMEPIWLHQGVVIDGRNRLRACAVAGVEPQFREWPGEGSLVAFVMSRNLHRRHLNPSQKAVVSLEVLPFLEDEAKERQRQAGREHGRGEKVVAISGQPIPRATHAPRSIAQAAALTGASATYVGQAKQLREEAPELLEQVRVGEIGIDTAARQMKARRSSPPTGFRADAKRVLTDKQVLEVSARRAAGAPVKVLAAEYGVSIATISAHTSRDGGESRAVQKQMDRNRRDDIKAVASEIEAVRRFASIYLGRLHGDYGDEVIRGALDSRLDVEDIEDALARMSRFVHRVRALVGKPQLRIAE